MKFNWVLNCFILLLVSCRSNNYVHPIEGELFGQQSSVVNVDLRHDGLYTLHDTSLMECGVKVNDHYKIYSPLLIINDTALRWGNYVGYFDNQPMTFEFYEQFLGKHFESRVGKYLLRNDTLLAKIPIILYGRGRRQEIYEAYFEGIVKNRDTILSWQMIPPYPQANEKWNDGFQFLKTPHMLCFVESEELLDIDSLYKERLYKARSK